MYRFDVDSHVPKGLDVDTLIHVERRVPLHQPSQQIFLIDDDPGTVAGLTVCQISHLAISCRKHSLRKSYTVEEIMIIKIFDRDFMPILQKRIIKNKTLF